MNGQSSEYQDEIVHQNNQDFLIINDSLKPNLTFLHLNIMKMQLSKLPILTVKLEKLIASYNLIEEIPSYLPNLKYLDLSNNLIQQIPESLGNCDSLQVLKLQNNKIQKFGQSLRLSRLRQLQIQKNPIKCIIIDQWLYFLQKLSFDWLVYVIDSHNDNNFHYIGSFHELSYLSLGKLKKKWINYNKQAKKKTEWTLFEFISVFFNVQSEDWKQTGNIRRKVSFLLYNAIQNNHYQFLEYININNKEWQYQGWIYQGKILFQHALKIGSQQIQNRMQQCKFNIINDILCNSNNNSNSNNSNNYLHLACKYNNSRFFQLLLNKNHNINKRDNKQNTILHEILKNFNEIKSPSLIQYIIKNIQNTNYKNIKKCNPLYYAINYGNNSIIKLFKYLKKNKKVMEYLYFNQLCGINVEQTILHYIVKQGNIQLLLALLELNIADPFIKNTQNVRPRKQKINYLGKKLLIAYQKLYLNNFFKSLINISDNKKVEQQYQYYSSIVNQQEFHIFSLQVLLLQLMKNYTFPQKLALIQSFIEHLTWINHTNNSINNHKSNIQFAKSIILLIKNLTHNFMLKQYLFNHLNHLCWKQQQRIYISSQLQNIYTRDIKRDTSSNLINYQEFQECCYNHQYTHSQGNQYIQCEQSAYSSVLQSQRKSEQKSGYPNFLLTICTQLVSQQVKIQVEPQAMQLRNKKRTKI